MVRLVSTFHRRVRSTVLWVIQPPQLLVYSSCSGCLVSNFMSFSHLYHINTKAFWPTVYAFTLGQFGMLAMRYAADADEEKRVNEKIKTSEFVHGLTILSSENSQSLHIGEMVLLELMRLGLVEKDRIRSIKARLAKVIPKGSAMISLNDLLAHNMIETTLEVYTYCTVIYSRRISL